MFVCFTTIGPCVKKTFLYLQNRCNSGDSSLYHGLAGVGEQHPVPRDGLPAAAQAGRGQGYHIMSQLKTLLLEVIEVILVNQEYLGGCSLSGADVLVLSDLYPVMTDSR